MIYTKDERAYILKHETGKYLSFQDESTYDHLTENPLVATKFSTRMTAELVVKHNKELDRNTMRWNSERVLADTISACTVKELKTHTEYEVEE